MTCIIGLVDNGKVYMGGDSMSSNGTDGRVTRLRKVFRREQFLIGYTTSFRMGQLLQHSLGVPTQKDDQSNMEYMVTTFIDTIRKLFKDKGYAEVKDNKEKGGRFLVGYKGQLYKIDGDFQVNEYEDNFDACGCGTDYAMAAMKALEGRPPQERILKSLEIAAYFSGAVAGPFYVEVLINKGKEKDDGMAQCSPKLSEL